MRSSTPLSSPNAPTNANTIANTIATKTTVIVCGARSQIGRKLLPRLATAGYRVLALSRQGTPDWAKDFAPEIQWQQTDIHTPESILQLPKAQILIHLAPLAVLPATLPVFAKLGVARVLAFSTSSKFSKAKSPIAAERAFAARLAEAETALEQACQAQNMHWTIFRPTLIYGCGMDRNVTVIRRIIQLCGFFPLLGAGSGRRQPVHADDLAVACVTVLDKPQCMNKAYELCGGETLTYRAMVERIFTSMGRTPHFLIIPLFLFELALRLLSLIPRYRDFNSAMAQRMNEHLEYSHAAACTDFGYTPRRFTP